jgi:twinkle protein
MLSGVIVGRTGHECGSRQGLNLYEEDGRVTGWCFSCKKYEPNPLNDKTMEQAGVPRTSKSPEEIQDELDEIATYPFHELKERKIGLGTMKYFNTRVSLDQARREDVEVHYYPYDSIDTKELSGYKYRIVEGKRIFSIGGMKNVYPFGWKQAIATGSPRLYITEGEIDAMSLFSTIMQRNAKDERYKGNIPAVVSIPHGASAAGKDLAKVAGEIYKHFKEVVLVFDNDDAGKAATEDALKVLPDAKVANLPCKDVNDCVLKGHEKALFNAVMFNAEAPKNTRLVYADDLFEAAKEQAEYGLSWPWVETTNKTRGIRFGETIYIGAAQKMG